MEPALQNVDSPLPAGQLVAKLPVMQSGALPLSLAPGWKNAPPRSTGRTLVWQSEGRWVASDTDFANPRNLGPVAQVECPPATDGERGAAYYYHCAGWGAQRDVSEIRRGDLAAGGSEPVFQLGLNKWALWLCRYLPERHSIAALVATEMPRRNDGGVVIQHQLGLFDLENQRSLLTLLPRDCFYPLALDPASERVLFHGAEGYQVVDFSGKRLWKLGGRGLPDGRGGAFHPEKPDAIVLGGDGLMLVRQSGEFERIHERGLNPVWSPDGETLYYSESSSDLWRWDPKTRARECLLAVAGNRYAEVNRARPVVVSPDGLFAAVTLTRRIQRQSLDGAVGGEPKANWAEWRAVCILDLQNREVWQTPGAGPLNWA
ncbi:MAG: hypothetical protein ACQKBV_02425 [Puniceicoccales bacterium]